MLSPTDREIKYRAWDKHTRRMWQWDEHNAFTTSRGSIKQWFEDSDLTPMLWTGLYDTQWAEIYEGDILQHKNGRRKVVKWHNGRNFQGFAISYEAPVVWTVIGNIYQNEDLIPA